jgi:Holliday junction resolvase
VGAIPVVTNGQRGADFERRCGRDLKAAGWYVVRAAGSHGEADLLALKLGRVWLVQCKRSGRLDPPEWNALCQLAEELGAVAVLAAPHRTNRRATFHQLTGRKVLPGARAADLMRQLDPHG